MAKTIYTERDIEDLVRRGTKEIVVTDDVYLTDAARERAEKIGVMLRTDAARPSAPVVPARTGSSENAERVMMLVKADVLAKLGAAVDAAIIDRIVRQVVGQLK